MTSEDVQLRKAEFAEHLVAIQGRLFGYIHSLVPDISHADDLYQQTALILWKKFTEFDRSRSFFAWACGVARMEVANFIRGLGRQRLYFSDDLNMLLIEAHEDLAEDELEDRSDALSRCVEKLKRDDRDLLADCYGGSGGVRGAAARRNRSPQSVYNSLRRIRRALFECIGRTLAQKERAGWNR